MKTTTVLAALMVFSAAINAAEPDKADASQMPASAANGDAGGPDAATQAKDQAEALAALDAAPVADREMCLIPGRPAASGNYAVLKKIKVARQTYGSVTLILPELVSQVRAAGGNAVVDYNGSQRFGFFPWRLVRPVATGTAIRWTGSQPLDCAAFGGSTLSAVMSSNKAPGR